MSSAPPAIYPFTDRQRKVVTNAGLRLPGSRTTTLSAKYKWVNGCGPAQIFAANWDKYLKYKDCVKVLRTLTGSKNHSQRFAGAVWGPDEAVVVDGKTRYIRKSGTDLLRIFHDQVKAQERGEAQFGFTIDLKKWPLITDPRDLAEDEGEDIPNEEYLTEYFHYNSFFNDGKLKLNPKIREHKYKSGPDSDGFSSPEPSTAEYKPGKKRDIDIAWSDSTSEADNKLASGAEDAAREDFFSDLSNFDAAAAGQAEPYAPPETLRPLRELRVLRIVEDHETFLQACDRWALQTHLAEKQVDLIAGDVKKAPASYQAEFARLPENTEGRQDKALINAVLSETRSGWKESPAVREIPLGEYPIEICYWRTYRSHNHRLTERSPTETAVSLSIFQPRPHLLRERLDPDHAKVYKGEIARAENWALAPDGKPLSIPNLVAKDPKFEAIYGVLWIIGLGFEDRYVDENVSVRRPHEKAWIFGAAVRATLFDGRDWPKATREQFDRQFDKRRIAEVHDDGLTQPQMTKGMVALAADFEHTEYEYDYEENAERPKSEPCKVQSTGASQDMNLTKQQLLHKVISALPGASRMAPPNSQLEDNTVGCYLRDTHVKGIFNPKHLNTLYPGVFNKDGFPFTQRRPQGRPFLVPWKGEWYTVKVRGVQGLPGSGMAKKLLGSKWENAPVTGNNFAWQRLLLSKPKVSYDKAAKLGYGTNSKDIFWVELDYPVDLSVTEWPTFVDVDRCTKKFAQHAEKGVMVEVVQSAWDDMMKAEGLKYMRREPIPELVGTEEYVKMKEEPEEYDLAKCLDPMGCYQIPGPDFVMDENRAKEIRESLGIFERHLALPPEPNSPARQESEATGSPATGSSPSAGPSGFTPINANTNTNRNTRAANKTKDPTTPSKPSRHRKRARSTSSQRAMPPPGPTPRRTRQARQPPTQPPESTASDSESEEPVKTPERPPVKKPKKEVPAEEDKDVQEQGHGDSPPSEAKSTDRSESSGDPDDRNDADSENEITATTAMMNTQLSSATQLFATSGQIAQLNQYRSAKGRLALAKKLLDEAEQDRATAAALKQQAQELEKRSERKRTEAELLGTQAQKELTAAYAIKDLNVQAARAVARVTSVWDSRPLTQPQRLKTETIKDLLLDADNDKALAQELDKNFGHKARDNSKVSLANEYPLEAFETASEADAAGAAVEDMMLDPVTGSRHKTKKATATSTSTRERSMTSSRTRSRASSTAAAVESIEKYFQ